jgi:ribosome modulation factor
MKKAPYLEGWTAYAKGKDRSQCPYVLDHAEHAKHDDWLEGWLDARDANVSQRKSSRKKKPN